MDNLWNYLKKLGQLVAQRRSGLYIALICPDEVISAIAISFGINQMLAKDLAFNKGERFFIRENDDKSTGKKSIFSNIEIMNGQKLYWFDQAGESRRAIPDTDLFKKVLPVRNQDQLEVDLLDWLTSGTVTNLAQPENVNWGATELVGVKDSLEKANNLLSRNGYECIPLAKRGGISLKSIMSNPSPTSDISVFSGDLPQEYPSKTQAIVSCLSWSDPNLHEKTQEFMKHLSYMTQTSGRPIHNSVNESDEELTTFFSNKPSALCISAAGYYD